MVAFTGIRKVLGFSLLEMALVLIIMAALLGSVLKPFGAHLQESKRAATRLQLQQIRESMIGFAAANHRLPCPAIDSGQENCDLSMGYVPAAVLGLAGAYDERGLLLDAWHQPVRYAVSVADANADGLGDFTQALQMQLVGMQQLSPDLEVCDQAAGCPQLRANQVAAVIVSTGEKGIENPSADEAENLDGDRRFVSRDVDAVGADRFDDVLVWLSENILYSRLIQAGVLP